MSTPIFGFIVLTDFGTSGELVPEKVAVRIDRIETYSTDGDCTVITLIDNGEDIYVSESFEEISNKIEHLVNGPAAT